ncbi:MAG TPA: hypothetical protein VJG83_05740 [archaeon]|nr:hypothetical protein [archaeon]
MNNYFLFLLMIFFALAALWGQNSSQISVQEPGDAVEVQSVLDGQGQQLSLSSEESEKISNLNS